MGVFAGAVAAYAAVAGHESVALTVCLVPLVIWVSGRPAIPLALLGACIPVLQSLTGGRAGFNLSISDLLLVFLGALILREATVTVACLPGEDL